MTSSLRLPLACFALLALLASGGCQKSEPAASDAAAKESAQPGRPAAGGAKDQLKTAREVFDRMAAAYKNATSYADFGTARLQVETSKGKIDEEVKFGLTLVRPNKLRMQFYNTQVVCDGKQWYAFIDGLPGQVVLRDAPPKLTLDVLKADRLLHEALSGGFGSSPQALLLLDDDSLSILLEGTQDMTLVEPETIEGRECYGVRVKRPDGQGTFWVDKETFALRRMTFPTDEFRKGLERDAEVKSVAIVADFKKAEFNGQPDPTAFQFEVPEKAAKVKFFMQRGPYELVGKKLPAFKFTDLQGKPVTPETFAGKITVLEFWQSTCEPCNVTLPKLEELYQKYKDNDKVALFAVSLDPPAVENKTLEKIFKDLGVSVPIVRENDQESGKVLQVIGPPSTLLVGPDGMLHDCDMGGNPVAAAALPQKVAKLLAGENLAKDTLAQLEQQMKQVEKAVDDVFQGKVQEPIRVKAAAKSEPSALKRTPLWKCADLKMPGNTLVVPQPGGTPRLFVIENLKDVAEIGPDGKLVATHKLDLQEEELISTLRTAVGGDGKRLFAAFATGHQRLHVLDENWKKLLSFPENALTNRHPGVAEVELGDVEGDGKLKAYVGYWGTVGIQEAGLDGKRLGWNKALMNVSQLAFAPPGKDGRRELLAANESGTIGVLDAKLNLRTNLAVEGEFIEKIVAADLIGDGKLQWCALAHTPDGDVSAIGLKFTGEPPAAAQVAWKYPLPKGRLQQPIEAIIAGRVTSGGPGCWLLPGCDGSVHILSVEGKLLDKFNHGSFLSGLATMEVDGKPVLVISSQGNGVEAWKIEP